MRMILAVLSLGIAFTSFEDAVLYLTGASTMEELSSEVLERYSNLHEHPISLNTAANGKLLSCGLFTAYQVAAIREYRRLHGDILSFTELEMVDGIPSDLAKALKHFITLESKSPPGKRKEEKLRLSGTISGKLNTSIVKDEKPTLKAGIKSNFELGERFGLAAGDKSFCGVWYGKRHLGKIVVGDYNARFGQGLTIWSGFDLSGYSSSNAFCKNGTGISPCSSFSGDHPRGIALDLQFGKWQVSLLSRKEGNFSGVLSWVGRRAEIGGLVSFSPKFSSLEPSLAYGAFFKFSAAGLTWFSEASLKHTADAIAPAAVLGMLWPIDYRHQLSISGKYQDQKQIYAIGYERKWLFTSFETNLKNSERKYKFLCTASHKFTSGDFSLTPKLRIQEKYTVTQSGNSLRNELRGEFALSKKSSTYGARFDLVYGRAFAWQSFLEYGLQAAKVNLWLRMGGFKVDNWDDRIYVYERDAPGSFSIPALYGRGINGSVFTSFRLDSKKHKRFRSKLYLRLSHTHYFSDKVNKTEIHTQYSLNF